MFPLFYSFIVLNILLTAESLSEDLANVIGFSQFSTECFAVLFECVCCTGGEFSSLLWHCVADAVCLAYFINRATLVGPET